MQEKDNINKQTSSIPSVNPSGQEILKKVFLNNWNKLKIEKYIHITQW